MPRKSVKAANNSAAKSSSKRTASGTPTRQSKRAKAATRKSYVEPKSDDEGNPSTAPERDDDAQSSDFGQQSDLDSPSESEQAEVDSEGDKPKRGKSRDHPAKQTHLPLHKKHATEKELWKPGAKLAPGTQLIIKKPKAREAGDIPYTDDTIHPNTLLFLRDLEANNERQWLKTHDPDYRNALQDFSSFVEKLSEKIIEADSTIPELPVKDIIFRIYRDVRFSKDQTPYKTHFSAAWSRTGRKGPYAAYYVQIQPNGGSLVGGGLWQPDAQPLSMLRRDIDREPQRIKRVLTDEGIREGFFGGVPPVEKKAVASFTKQPMNQSNALKKHPKGYENDHKDIELLRLRNFTLGTKVSDEQVAGPKGLEHIAELLTRLVPFITYLNSVVMPDDSDESEASEDSSEEDGENGESGDGSGGEGEGDG